MIRRTAAWWVSVILAGVVALVGWFALQPRFNGLPGNAPSRAAQSDLNDLVTLDQGRYAATGSLDDEPALAGLANAQGPFFTLVKDRSVGHGTHPTIAVTVSADRQAALFAIRALDGRCWFAYVDHRPAGGRPPFPDVPSTPGTYYGGVGTGHGPNSACSVTQGAAGTGGNTFVGWSTGTYPQAVR